MTVSIGLSMYQVDGVTEQELLSQADEAMYVAKRLGRNQVRTAEEARQMGADVELLAFFEQEKLLKQHCEKEFHQSIFEKPILCV